MRHKIELLLTLADGADERRLDEALREETERLDAGFPDKLLHRAAFHLRNPELEKIAAGHFSFAPPFDAMMEITRGDGGTLDGLVPLLEGFAERRRGLIRPEASGVLAGTENVVLPGSGKLLVLITNRRLPRFTHEGFIDYWWGSHGPLAREITAPGALRYRQIHGDMALSARVAQATGLSICDFDGASECYFTDAAHLRDLMGKTEVVAQAKEDEDRFVEHQRCVASLLEMRED